jgi:hypothetical protein
MYYDSVTGARHHGGLFSGRTVIVMVVLLVLAGAYIAVNYFAPDLAVTSLDDKQAIEQAATDESVSHDVLRIPSVGIDVPVSEKLVEGSVVYSEKGGHITLTAKQRVIGATPWDTIKLSPIYQLHNIKNQANIFLDFSGQRTTFTVKNVVYNTTLSNLQQSDLVINATHDDDPNQIIVSVQAEKFR